MIRLTLIALALLAGTATAQQPTPLRGLDSGTIGKFNPWLAGPSVSWVEAVPEGLATHTVYPHPWVSGEYYAVHELQWALPGADSGGTLTTSWLHDPDGPGGMDPVPKEVSWPIPDDPDPDWAWDYHVAVLQMMDFYPPAPSTAQDLNPVIGIWAWLHGWAQAWQDPGGQTIKCSRCAAGGDPYGTATDGVVTVHVFVIPREDGTCIPWEGDCEDISPCEFDYSMTAEDLAKAIWYIERERARLAKLRRPEGD